MHVDEALLAKLEKLSHIQIDDSKRQETITNLQNILSFVENLSEIDTHDTQEKFLMTRDATPMREDIAVCKTDIADAILSNAPHTQAHFFVVPKIIE